jgi:hypothetical protein
MNVAAVPNSVWRFIYISNVFVSSSVHTVRIAIDEPARILLTAITIFLVCLKVELTGSVVLHYTDRGSALKPTIHEVILSSKSRLQRQLHVRERLTSSEVYPHV